MAAAGELLGRRVAIVHERFTEPGGSERCVEQFHEIWPSATVHAAVLNEAALLPPGLRGADIRPTNLQRFYRGGRGYAHLLPLLPRAMSRIDVGDVDLVIASHHAFSNRVQPPPGVPVVSYTYTPARWLWEPAMIANEIGGRVGRAGLGTFARVQRQRDRAAAQRVRGVIAISRHVAGRVQRWWRDATVVHPPVDVDYYSPAPEVPREDFCLLAGRLVPYKRPEVAVAAAEQAGVKLVVVGDGRSRAAVEAAAGPRTEILGAVDDATLRDLYRRCRALVFPGEEDFGIVPVEAQACGAPVIAFGVGGVLDTVVDGQTGLLYDGAGPEPLAGVMRAFGAERFNPARIRSHAEGFSPDRFREAFLGAVARILDLDSGA